MLKKILMTLLLGGLFLSLPLLSGCEESTSETQLEVEVEETHMVVE
ncbi:hypothetical protein LCGC14_0335410 [marine sediment metagenome]|uniref:Uncharacterized protein n=1 Tax=marine sediment metagenome TaxID=412755 RepID=A0A0F9TY78_9ZZZZ